jgi:hypothetical protein
MNICEVSSEIVFYAQNNFGDDFVNAYATHSSFMFYEIGRWFNIRYVLFFQLIYYYQNYQ